MKYFAESDLAAAGQPEESGSRRLQLLTQPELDDLAALAREFTRHTFVLVSRASLHRKPHVRLYVSILQSLGAIRIQETPRDYHLEVSGKLAKHLPEIVFLYLSESLTLIDNWETTRVVPDDSISAVEFIRQFELRRVELTRRSGRDVRPLAERPVAFAVFHAVNKKGEDCYLFEVNKDWRRLNLIGGKQEESDQHDYAVTALREIGEELGLPADRVSLTRLNEDPLKEYGLSGNAGSLASYPCVLYGASVDGPLPTGQQNRWLTERQIRTFRDLPDSPLMVNPLYLDYLLSGSPSRLSRTPISTPEKVRFWEAGEIAAGSEEVVRRWVRVLNENKDLLAAILTLVAALLTLALAL